MFDVLDGQAEGQEPRALDFEPVIKNRQPDRRTVLGIISIWKEYFEHLFVS